MHWHSHLLSIPHPIMLVLPGLYPSKCTNWWKVPLLVYFTNGPIQIFWLKCSSTVQQRLSSPRRCLAGLWAKTGKDVASWSSYCWSEEGKVGVVGHTNHSATYIGCQFQISGLNQNTVEKRKHFGGLTTLRHPHTAHSAYHISLGHFSHSERDLEPWYS